MRGISVPRRTPKIELTPEQQEFLGSRRPHVACMDVGRTGDWAGIGTIGVADGPAPDPWRPTIVVKSLLRAPHGTKHRVLAREMGRSQAFYAAQGHPTICALDATGIGDGTAEMIAEQVPVCFQIVITGGDKVVIDDKVPWRFRVPKRELVDIIVRVVSDGRLDITGIAGHADPNGQDMKHELEQELEAFSRLVTPRPDGSSKVEIGNDTALAGHDDLVLTLAVGLWALDYGIRTGVLVDPEQWMHPTN